MIRSFLLVAVSLLAACAMPYTLPADDRAAIATRITNFERAFVAGNTAEVDNVMPPRMINATADTGGLSEKGRHRQMANLTRETTPNVKIVSFNVALNRALFPTTPSGRGYDPIPTKTLVQTPSGAKLQSHDQTPKLEDGGKWYPIYIDESRQIELMREVYPDFEGVTFPKATPKVIG